MTEGHSYFYFCFSSHFPSKSFAPNRNPLPPKKNPNTLTQHPVTGTQKYRLFFFALFMHISVSHSDSLDTLLYVRFAIQNLEFYEWKLGDHGWALSWHRTHTLFALWPDVTSCFTYEKTESEEVFSIVSYIRFKNLQFHWRIYNSIGVCILMRGVQWALWFVTSSWSKCLSNQRFASKLCARWAARRRLISNILHGVISLSILANKPSSFS